MAEADGQEKSFAACFGRRLEAMHLPLLQRRSWRIFLVQLIGRGTSAGRLLQVGSLPAPFCPPHKALNASSKMGIVGAQLGFPRSPFGAAHEANSRLLLYEM
jgi:hypothetical protein